MVELPAHRLFRGMAHDVRTPLNAITGFSYLLQSESHGPLNSRQHEFVCGIQLAVDRAIAIIESLTHLTEADKGVLEVNAEPTPLTPLVRELVKKQAGVMERADQTLEATFMEVGEVSTDPELVQRVLSNLLSNAIKYNTAGGTVRVEVLALEAGVSPLLRDSVAIRVSDTGPGIPREFQEQVFNEFVRLPNSEGERGSGLGLSIARRIAHALGGRLLLRSWPGAGSEFTLWLPIQPRII